MISAASKPAAQLAGPGLHPGGGGADHHGGAKLGEEPGGAEADADGTARPGYHSDPTGQVEYRGIGICRSNSKRVLEPGDVAIKVLPLIRGAPSPAAITVGPRGPGTRVARAIGHFCPEGGELRWWHLLPGSRARARGTPGQEGLLAAAERLRHLHPGLHALWRIGAELEGAAVHAGASRRRRGSRSDGPPWVEGSPGAGDARRQVGAVRALEAPLAVAWLITPLGQVEQQQNVSYQPLGTPIERGPSGGRRDPQAAMALPRACARVTGTHLSDDAALVDPAVPLGIASRQGPGLLTLSTGDAVSRVW